MLDDDAGCRRSERVFDHTHALVRLVSASYKNPH